MYNDIFLSYIKKASKKVHVCGYDLPGTDFHFVSKCVDEAGLRCVRDMLVLKNTQPLLKHRCPILTLESRGITNTDKIS